MTAKQLKQVIRVCGENFKDSDIPAIWRKQEFENEMKLLDALDRQAEDTPPEEEPEEVPEKEEFEDEDLKKQEIESQMKNGNY